MSNTQFDSLKCPICYDTYDLGEHIPSVLSCGHTLCKKCVAIIQGGANPKCPIDKKAFHQNRPRVNFTLRSFVEEISQKDYCKDHFRECNLYCIEHRAKVCDSCVESNNHQGHQVKPIQEILVEANIRKDQFKATNINLDKYYTKMCQALEDKKKVLSTKINQEFDNLAFLMQLKRQDLLFEVGIKFNTERKRLDELYRGDKTGLKEHINEVVKRLENTISKKDLHLACCFNSSDFHTVLDEHWLREKTKEFDLKFAEIIGFFEKSLDEIKLPLMDLALFDETFVNNPVNYVMKSNLTSKFQEVIVNPQLKSSLKIVHNARENLLVIFIQDQPSYDTPIDIEKWKQVSGVKIHLAASRISQENLNALIHLLIKFEKAVSVSIQMENQKDVCEQSLKKLLDLLTLRSKQIETLFINFGFSDIKNTSVLYLGEQIIPNLCKLQSLTINLQKTKVTSDSVKIMIQKSLPILRNLSTFSLDIGDLKVPEDVVSGILVAMPKVKKLSLGLRSIALSDNVFQQYVNNIVPSNLCLQELELNMEGTNITETSLIDLFSGLSNLKSFVLWLNDRVLSDASKRILRQNRILKLENLRRFNIIICKDGKVERTEDKTLFYIR